MKFLQYTICALIQGGDSGKISGKIAYSKYHLALSRTSTDGITWRKLEIILAALQCSLLSESKSSYRMIPSHTDIA